MKFMLILITPIMIFAHSLSVTASYESGDFFVESYFGNGDACKDCTFKVQHDNVEIFKDVLDKEGVFEKSIQLETPFIVHVDGGMGHHAQVEIEGNELMQEGDLSQENILSTDSINLLNEEKLKKIIQSELKKQNIMIEAMIEKHKSKTEQILMGIGYILGIFGLWQLFARRYQK